jgi:hypothetical protein
MAEQDPVTLNNPTGERFHALKCAPKRSTPRIIVEYDGPLEALALDFGLGEPGQERKVLEVNKLGEFLLPEVMAPGGLLSYRVGNPERRDQDHGSLGGAEVIAAIYVRQRPERLPAEQKSVTLQAEGARALLASAPARARRAATRARPMREE